MKIDINVDFSKSVNYQDTLKNVQYLQDIKSYITVILHH